MCFKNLQVIKIATLISHLITHTVLLECVCVCVFPLFVPSAEEMPLLPATLARKQTELGHVFVAFGVFLLVFNHKC